MSAFKMAILLLLALKGYPFCPFKFVQKVRNSFAGIPSGIQSDIQSPLKCSEILTDLLELGLVEKVFDCSTIAKDGGIDKVLKNAIAELTSSGDSMGILLYSTEFYNHSVTVVDPDSGDFGKHCHGSSKVKLPIYNAEKNEWFEKSEPFYDNISRIQAIKLSPDKEGTFKKWLEDCGTETCHSEELCNTNPVLPNFIPSEPPMNPSHNCQKADSKKN